MIDESNTMKSDRQRLLRVPAKEPNTVSCDQGVPVGTDLRLSDHVRDVVVHALADALVADYQEDTDTMVNSPRGKDHESGDAPT